MRTEAEIFQELQTAFKITLTYFLQNYPFSVRGFCTAVNPINSANSATCTDSLSIAPSNCSSFNNVTILEL